MLKLTSSFYRCIIVARERLDYKTQLRKHGYLISRRTVCCAQRVDQQAYRKVHSSQTLRETKEPQIMVPTLFESVGEAEDMSESSRPTCDHVSYGGSFVVSSTDTLSCQDFGHGEPSFEQAQPRSSVPPDFRCWEPVFHPVDSAYFASMHERGLTPYAFQFRVVSYNVLAQYLLECHPYLYKGCSPENLKWDVRAMRLYDEICGLDPDVICLQEVQASHLQLPPYSLLAGRGYGAVYKQKTGARHDGCAIYYKKDKFTLIDHAHVEFYQPAVAVLNRDNVGLMAKLAPRCAPAPAPVVVATTHLLYNPKRADVRLAQMQLFLAEIDRFAHVAASNGSGHLPIIMTGDFNSPPESSVVRLLDDGSVSATEYRDSSSWEQIGVTDRCQHLAAHLSRLEGRDADVSRTQMYNSEYRACSGERSPFSELFRRERLQHALRLASVYSKCKESGPEASSYQDRWLTVDYMYFSCHNLRLVSRLRLPTAQECEALDPLPNDVLASDHLALAATFELYPCAGYS